MFAGHSISIEYDELFECRLPGPDRAFPFLRRFAQAQVEQFAHRLVVGEGSPPLDDLAQTVVQRLDRVFVSSTSTTEWRPVATPLRERRASKRLGFYKLQRSEPFPESGSHRWRFGEPGNPLPRAFLCDSNGINRVRTVGLIRGREGRRTA